MLWIDRLFTFFGNYDKRSDTLKDSNGNGIWERYNKAIGKSLDNEVQVLIDNLMKNIYDPETCYDRYVVYLESMMGYNQKRNTLYIDNLLSTRRNMLKKILRLYQIKGTKRCYDLLFSMLGLTVVYTEYFNDYGFDSAVTLDDPIRTWDMKCDTCSGYTLALTGANPISGILYNGIWSIIMFNQPVNAVLLEVTYNGTALANPVLSEFDASFSNSFTNP